MDDKPPAGTSMADVLLVFLALVYPVAFTYIYFLGVAAAPQWARQAVYVVGKAIQFGLPLVWLFTVRRSPIRWAWPRGMDLALGAAFGIVTVSAMAAMGWLWLIPAGYFDGPAALMREKVAQYGITTPQSYIVLSAFYCIPHSLLEEYYWRWFAFGLLLRFVPLRAAIVISSVAFAAHHLLVVATYFGWLSPLTWLMAGGVAAGGAFWAWLYHRSGTLWAAWLSHFIVDAGVYAIGYQLIAHVTK